ncbi:MAG TPA: hypothetical protein VKA84_14550, partial [Gemmatimonadaceae bacterium]|nr:hypothetical protein [Gemmatimonadaceae bacterium]
MQPISPRLRAAGARATGVRAAGARITGALCLALGAACADDPTASVASDGEGAAATLQIVSGNNQQAAPGADLAQPLVVRALNSSGTPIANQIITFVVTAGGGSVYAGSAKTNSTGYAREWWTLGPAAGLNRVEARAVNASTGAKQVFGVFEATGTTSGGGTTTPPATTPAPVATVTVTPNPASVPA